MAVGVGRTETAGGNDAAGAGARTCVTRFLRVRLGRFLRAGFRGSRSAGSLTAALSARSGSERGVLAGDAGALSRVVRFAEDEPALRSVSIAMVRQKTSATSKRVKGTLSRSGMSPIACALA